MRSVIVVKNKNTQVLLTFKKLVLIFFVWLILYDPPIFTFVNVAHILGGMAIIYLVTGRRINIHFLKMEMILSGIFIYCVLVFIINGQPHDNLVASVSSLIFIIVDLVPIGLAFAVFCKKSNIYFDDFMKLLIAATVFEAVLAFVALINSGVQQAFFRQMIRAGYSESHFRIWGFRTYGFASNLQYSTPLTMTIISLFAFERGLKEKKAYLMLLSVFIVVMAYINARTSALIFILGVMVILLYDIRHFSSVFKIVTISTCMLVVGIFVLNSIKVKTEQIQWLKDGIYDILAIFGAENKAIYKTTAYFQDVERFRLPSGILNLLFGTGTYVMSENVFGYYTDIGFINDIWYGGIVYLIFLLICFGNVLNYIRLKINNLKHKCNNCIFGILLVSCVVCNLKGILFGFNNIIALIFIMYSYLVINGGTRDE